MAKQGLGVADLAVKNPQIGAPVMTVGDIAAALKPISPDTAGNRERIIHWGRAGALEPIGHAGGGPGKHRLYSSDAKFDAAVLHVLTSAGLPVNRSQFLPDVMAYARAQLVRWKKAPTKPLPALVISSTAEGGISVGAAAANNAVMTISIDLAKVWARVSP